MLKILDLLFSPLTYISARWLRFVRGGVINGRLKQMPITRKILYDVKVFPIIDHYYQPLFNPIHLRKSLNEARNLTGINLNSEKQLKLINGLSYQDELLALPMELSVESKFYYKNGAFGPGDAECYYSMIREKKPKKIIEIGSGNSTLIALEAINKNKSEDSTYKCELICIEPFEMNWLESLGVTVIRKLVEDIEVDFFKQLNKNDILFIDSSHVIRPQGDVLYEYLSILPALNAGVIIHIHDITTPSDYPYEWVIEDARFWNEQYLLESFLSCNNSFEILCSLAYLRNKFSSDFFQAFPVIKNNPNFGATSFWIEKTA
jgi:predicted O-methyltransferase YrrM